LKEEGSIMIRYAVISVLLLGACAHDRDRASTTTVTSGTPEGVRVTNVTIGDYDPAERLAGELCQREATCGRIDPRASDEAKLLGEQNCVTMNAPRMRTALQRWTCSPMTHRVLFEECLAAVRSEQCETRIESPDILPRCRSNAVCVGE
jgi:hypothetical protein